jgi:hypothetical protein
LAEDDRRRAVFGITRINITSGWYDWRIKLAEDHRQVANNIYRQVFDLAEGETIVDVSKEEALARYDWREGIDIILATQRETRMTLQEKCLTYWRSTITFEETKSNGEPGAWYYCTAQYYFIGYTRQYWDYKLRRIIDSPIIGFQDYIIIDLPRLHREDEADNIRWRYNRNQHDGRLASFRFIHFNDVPNSCIIVRGNSVNELHEVYQP